MPVAEAASTKRAKQRALTIGIDHGEPMSELAELLLTAGVAVVGSLTQKRAAPDPDRYLGRGKLIEAKEEVARTGANLVVCDDELVPRQERNLEAALGVPVLDRTAVILDIFALHAHTAEGKLQVELAQLEYNLARMRGLWTHLERLGAGRLDGGIGTRGPGESQIETDRRLARDRIAKLRRRIEDVGRSRAVMRAERVRSPVPAVALVGYTNAGKSSLMRAITGAEVGVGDMLFHTLDPTTRGYSHHQRDYLLTDTVGFIRKLPHQLIDAFRATLVETTSADLIIHVIDASEPRRRRAEIETAVEETLGEIGAGKIPRVRAFNKIDLVPAEDRADVLVGEPDAVATSALTGDGVPGLLDLVEEALSRTMVSADLFFGYDAQDSLSELHAIAGRLERKDREDGVEVHAELPATALARFERFITEPNGNGSVTPADQDRLW